MRLIPATLVLLLLVGAFLAIPSGDASAAQEGSYVYEITGTPGTAIITDYVGPGGAIVIPSALGGCDVTAIDDDAFSWTTSLNSVVIPNCTTSIGYASFYRCTALTSVTIGTGITTIAYGAFYACSSLKSIIFLGLTAPSSVAGDWTAYTSAEIRGHAYAASNFPLPGGDFHGLMMGTVVPAPPSVPGAPTNLTATSGPGFVGLSWNAPLNQGNPSLTRYDVYRGLSSGIYTGPIGNAPSATLTYEDRTATPGVTYFYMVRAVNSVGPSLPSNQAVGTASSFVNKPGMPLDVSAEAGPSYVQLTWSPPAFEGDSPVTNYSIQRGLSSGGEGPIAIIGNVLAYKDEGLVNGQTYWYEVRAINAVGEGDPSKEVSAAPETTPSPPRGLQATSLNQEVELSWTSPEYAGPGSLSYHLFKEGKLIWNGTALAYNDFVVAEGVTYSYKVAAQNSIGWGLNCTAVPATPFGPPSAPRSLTSAPGDQFIDLFWVSPFYPGPGTLTYHLFRDGGEIWQGTAANYHDSMLIKGEEHYYMVAASNPVGWGPNSSSVLVAALGVPDVPKGLTATPGDGWVDLSWTAPNYNGPGILTYHLFRNSTEIWSGTETGHTDTSVVNGIRYSYQIGATNSIGWGERSSEVQVTPLPGDTVPARPNGLAATAGNGFIDLEWAEPLYLGPGTITYHLIRDGSSLWVGVGTSYRDSQLTKGELHSYTVAAQNSLGLGPNCTAVTDSALGVPDPPWGLVAMPRDGSVDLAWSAVNYSGPGMLVYHLFRDDILIWSGSGTIHVDLNVTKGSEYAYNLAASNSVGWGENSSSVPSTPFGPPNVPLNLVAIPGNGNVTLTWEASNYSGPGPLVYHVFRDSEQSPLWNGTGLNLIDERLAKGINHWYTVAASNGIGWGSNTSEISAIPFGPPDRPVGLLAIPGNEQIVLNWTAPAYIGAGSIDYHLFRDDMLIWSGTELAFTDSGLVDGHGHIYEVSASNSVGWGPNSSALESAPFAPLAPNPPTAFSVTAGNNSVMVTWGSPSSTGSSPLIGYRVLRGTDPSELQLLATVTFGTNYEDSQVVNEQKYYYQVNAYNSVGDSQPTEILDATLHSAAAAAPPPMIDFLVAFTILGLLTIGGAILIVRRRRH